MMLSDFSKYEKKSPTNPFSTGSDRADFSLILYGCSHFFKLSTGFSSCFQSFQQSFNKLWKTLKTTEKECGKPENHVGKLIGKPLCPNLRVPGVAAWGARGWQELSSESACAVDNLKRPGKTLFSGNITVFFALFCRAVAPSFSWLLSRSGIMVEKYPENPGKLSTLSTKIYKQIVDNLLSLGKREVESHEDIGFVR